MPSDDQDAGVTARDEDMVTIHTGEIPKGEQWIIHGRVIAKLYISTGLDAVDAAFAASRAAVAPGAEDAP